MAAPAVAGAGVVGSGWQHRRVLLWLLALVVGIPFAIALWFATGIWVLYRIIRGWLALTSQKALPQ